MVLRSVKLEKEAMLMMSDDAFEEYVKINDAADREVKMNDEDRVECEASFHLLV